jgi:uncharacterized lipoprotein NlpE involved in copper resistance
MIMKKISLSFLLLSLALTACKNETKTEDHFSDQKEIVNGEQGMDGHTSINALDWEGTYEGTIPCSDCDGIFTALTINNDETYVMHSTRIKGDKKDKTSQKGLYQWDESGSVISIEMNGKTTSYRVGENKLILLDDQGQLMPETQTENYFLLKKEIKDEE